MTSLWRLLAAIAVLGACSALNEDIAPSVDCATDPSIRVCEDAVLATCSNGEPTYRVCEDEGLVCGDGDGGADCVACAQQCENRVCGGDGCGGTCGVCPDSSTCTVNGRCDPPVAFRVVGYDVVDDDNGDGVVSPGESGALRIRLENTGIERARQARATIVVETAGAGIDAGPVLYFGDIDVGAVSCGASVASALGDCATLSLPRFRASGDLLGGGQSIRFRLTVSTVEGYAVETEFSYELVAIDQDVAVASATVVTEPNNDGVLSPGEAATVRVVARNDGFATAVGLFGVLSAVTPGVTVLSPTVYFGDLGPDQTSCGSRTQAEAGSCASTVLSTVRVSPTVTGPWITFRVTFYDGFGTESETMFTQGIGPIDQAFSLAEGTIVSDASGDGVISPGEWGILRIEVSNSGSAGALGVTGALTSTDPRINVNNGAKLYFGDIDAGAGGCGSWKISHAGSCTSLSIARITVSSGVLPGTVVSLPLEIVDVYGNATGLSYQFTVAP